MGIDVDENKWPILLVNASGDSSDRDLHAYLRALERALLRCEPHVVIVNAVKGKSLKSSHRKMVADWNRENQEELRKYRRGLCLVTDSSFLRGMITATYWIFPAPFPYHPVSNFAQAWIWARQQLGQKRTGTG